MFPSPDREAWLEAADGTVVPLGGNCGFGRSSKNAIVIPSDRASRQHAVIHAQNGDEWWLIDPGSVNGTFLNSQRVGQPTPLQAGDKIGVADFEWIFQRNERPNGAVDDELSQGETLATTPMIRNVPCWLLLADIQDFTPLSQRLAPEELAQMVGRWLRASRDTIKAEGGTVNKYLGDGFLAFWLDVPESPQRLSAALKVLAAEQTLAEPPFRIVVHYGRVAMGGNATLGEESLMGPEVNFIFRLEKLAGSIRLSSAISEPAAALLTRWIPCTPIDGAYALKGFEGQHRVFTMADVNK
jgi:class 3 adenylate cyclase